MAMNRWMWLWIHAAYAAILGTNCVVAMAMDDPVLTSAYGTGVHAYHAGDYQRSYDDLTAVIDGGSSDPRAFYFRGLAALKLGRIDEAEADFAAGATREAAAVGSWNVPRSLERIQGEDRLRLERHRARARVALMQRRREAIVRRYTEVDAAQEGVLRRRRPETVPARETPAVAGGEAEANGELPEPEPDADDAPAEEAPADEEPMAEETDSPFEDEPAAEEESVEGEAAEDEAMEDEPAAEPEADAADGEEEGESIPE